MPKRLTIAVLAVALSAAGLPAFAAEMPAYGTKNFTPGGATPAYFTHNTAAPTVRSEDWSAADQGAAAVDAAEPPSHAPAAEARHHAKLSAHHRAGSRTAGKTKDKSRATHLAVAKPGRATRTESAAHARSAGSAGKASSAGKARTASHGKSATRHVAARSSERKG
ncbi:MAG: hypothetical protein ACREFH_00565 [Stellaceae bacterium]